MIQEKLRDFRKQKGMSQEKMAKILATDTSSYSRKENGKTKIHDDEWEKMAKALDIPVEELKGEIASGVVHNENSTLHDQSGSYIHNYNIPNSIIESLQDYIHLLKNENQSLKKEVEDLKQENTVLKSQK
ncbi:transcriptional regulator with XRE-family HTH domain [Chryseobacterium ginsenosidimutans]|uniref:helix-turn-helix transcriptional regulator n=1 Tax=Chryseobacterium ginsenosidimutans TaxID=687846 RepID=UPI00278257F8|nr:helix-turn-helix transcriptional regulator [Chryseobacterium ginsenosidimutans]MDQ0591651.1 transcriptional regulator with XRE-family HTH domain [Chryseobacterium ginsenosidimutans]